MNWWQRFSNRFLPLLYVDLAIPFLRARTAVMYRRYENMTFTYIAWDFQLFKWRFEVDLYKDKKGRYE
jgi:hypothetical protein